MPRKRSKNAPAAAQTTVRQLEALELRQKGLSYERIGAQLGVTKEAAWQLVDRAMRDLRESVKETAAEVRELELARLDELTFAWLPAAKCGDDKAAGVVLKTMERRAKLLGLDAASKTELTGKDGQPIASVTATAALDLSALSTDQLATLADLLSAAEPKKT